MTFPLTGRSVVLDYGDQALRYDFGVEGLMTTPDRQPHHLRATLRHE